MENNENNVKSYNSTDDVKIDDLREDSRREKFSKSADVAKEKCSKTVSKLKEKIKETDPETKKKVLVGILGFFAGLLAVIGLKKHGCCKGKADHDDK